MKGIICSTITVVLISILEFTDSKSIPEEGTSLRAIRSIVDFGKKCKPESRYTEGCNLCICSIYGYALCTAMECHTPVIYTEPKEACTPGRRWKQDCNTCYCTDDAKVKCSKLQCDGLFRETNFVMERDKREASWETCIEGQVTRQGCTYCFCGRNGLKCIPMLCFGPELSATVVRRRDPNDIEMNSIDPHQLPI